MTQQKKDVVMPDAISTGVEGLDGVLNGGLTSNRLYLVEGSPGAGKTTLALQFLIEGAKHGERVLYVTLSETEAELRAVAASHDWTLEGVDIHEVIPDEQTLDPDQQYTMFLPSEVELGETTQAILSSIDALKPTRVVIDSLSELRLLAGTPLKYRRQVLAYKQYFAKRNCTAIMVDDKTAHGSDQEVKSIAHGVITLEQVERDYGADRRRLRIQKYRGVSFRSGFHDYSIRHGGLVVYQRLVAAESRGRVHQDKISFGTEAFDELLGGGIEQGTSTILNGPSGTGKSTLAAQFVSSAVKQGCKAAVFLFEESANTLLNRSEQLNIDLKTPIADGRVTLQEIDPAELSPGELAYVVQEAVEKRGVKVVVLDSLNGYLNSSPDERFLITHLHELLAYLAQRGVASMLVGVQSGLVGTMRSAIDISYLADNVLLLRHFEHQGHIKQAMSVFKKRGGAHQKIIRELTIGSEGLQLGDPLKNFHGVLTGVPVYTGDRDSQNDGPAHY
ncbi:ATPase domain-containing protein [Marinobacter salicampi]|uniref:ATPase domain-containing protein n=1 Tax=Marinobacter salicampi TaxID=435907 RepID=UPI001408AFF1|nr:ATPase domain-containing protein [Marinobacter salicampi]